MVTKKDQSIYIMGIKKHLLRQYSSCRLCGIQFSNLKDVSIDHILPLSKGGSDRLDNLQLAHKECNIKKGNKIL